MPPPSAHPLAEAAWEPRTSKLFCSEVSKLDTGWRTVLHTTVCYLLCLPLDLFLVLMTNKNFCLECQGLSFHVMESLSCLLPMRPALLCMARVNFSKGSVLRCSLCFNARPLAPHVLTVCGTGSTPPSVSPLGMSCHRVC